MAGSIKAIETRYKGYRFRSRLEARWAVFFDALGIPWEYEKEGYKLPSGYYLPDFWIPLRKIEEYPSAGYWIEIKPIMPSQLETRLMLELTATTGHHGFILAGTVGEFKTQRAIVARTQDAIAHAQSRIGSPRFAVTEFGDVVPLNPPLCCMTISKTPFLASVLYGNDNPEYYGFSDLDQFLTVCQLSESATGCRKCSLDDAITAARSARFEHGETPNK